MHLHTALLRRCTCCGAPGDECTTAVPPQGTCARYWQSVIVLHALALAGQAPRKVGEAAAGTARLRGGVCTCTQENVYVPLTYCCPTLWRCCIPVDIQGWGGGSYTDSSATESARATTLRTARHTAPRKDGASSCAVPISGTLLLWHHCADVAVWSLHATITACAWTMTSVIALGAITPRKKVLCA